MFRAVGQRPKPLFLFAVEPGLLVALHAYSVQRGRYPGSSYITVQ